MAEIGSEVEELKRKLKEARKSEKLEKREKRQQEYEKKKSARLQKRQDVQEEKLRKKEDRLQAQKEKREAVARFHEQEAEERSLRKNLAVQTEEETVKEKQPIPVKDTEQVETKGREENAGDLDILPVTWASSYLSISQIKNGVIQTKDERYIKIIEILPINFLLRSASEKRNIIYSFASYLKIAPPNLQFKVLSKKADIKEYIEKIRREAEQEPDERCRILQEDYAKLLTQLGTREAITRRFFLIFEYPLSGTKSVNERDMFLYLQSAVQTAKKYLAMCGNVVLEHKNETRFCVEVFYQLLNRDTSLKTTLDERIEKVRNHYILENGKESVAKIPVTELIAPDSLNFKSYKYVILDGIYHAYLYIPSGRYIFFSLLVPDMTHEEKQLLDEAMVICYQEKGITHDNQSLFDPTKPGGYRKMPILGDLHEVLLRKEECKRLANILNRLVNGSAASFNQQTNVDLNNKYVVLDISELSGDLLIGMFVALDYVWSRTKEDRTREKAIFIDEAWKLLSSNELAADYIQGIYKTIRAYGGAAISASQDLVDYYELNGGKIGRGILSNAKTKIILNLEVAEAELIQKELDLSEAEFNSIVHFERGCGLISTNSNNLVVEFKASQLEKDLITTDRKDLQKLKGRIQKYGESAYGNTE